MLVTGPTGSGKSTTLASMIDWINTHRRVPHPHHRGPDRVRAHTTSCRRSTSARSAPTPTTSHAALRSALREDPDVLLVGEMRDPESIAVALTIAETGHLVFATLHTNDTAQALDRIVDVFPAERQRQIRVQLASTARRPSSTSGCCPGSAAAWSPRSRCMRGQPRRAQPHPRGQDPPAPQRRGDAPERGHADARDVARPCSWPTASSTTRWRVGVSLYPKEVQPSGRRHRLAGATVPDDRPRGRRLADDERRAGAGPSRACAAADGRARRPAAGGARFPTSCSPASCRPEGGWVVASAKLQGIQMYPNEPELLDAARRRPGLPPVVQGHRARRARSGCSRSRPTAAGACDREARQLIGFPRAGAIPTPPGPARRWRPTTYEEAADLSGGMGAVTWGLLPRFAEVDEEMAPYRQRTIFEVQPELSFFQLNDDKPMQFSKRSHIGMEERKALLKGRIQGMERIVDAELPKVRPWQLIDAAACLWTTRRIASRAMTRIPEDPRVGRDRPPDGARPLGRSLCPSPSSRR